MPLKQHRPTGRQRAGSKGRSAPASLGGSPARPGGQSPTPRSDRRSRIVDRLRRHERERPTLPCSEAEGKRILPHAFTRARRRDGPGPTLGRTAAATRGGRIWRLPIRRTANRGRHTAHFGGSRAGYPGAGEQHRAGPHTGVLGYDSALEAAVQGQKSLPDSVFDVEPTSSEFSVEVGAWSGGMRRVEKLETGLTPKQAILLLLQEATPSTALKSMFGI